MDVCYAPGFLRLLKNLPVELREEVIEKLNLFRELNNHKQLKVHKLGGRLSGRFSFSVNYKTRIVFRYLDTRPRQALLLAIGDHEIYK